MPQEALELGVTREAQMDFATFAQAINGLPPRLPLYLCQGQPFALLPRWGQPVICYVPAETDATLLTKTLEMAYLSWGNPSVTFVFVSGYPPDVLDPVWQRHVPGSPA